MSKRARIGLAVVFIAIAALIVGAAALQSASVSIDNAHWAGYPMPPCFQNAKICGGHVLGTDENGRDLLARLVVGSRTSLGISFFTLLLELIFGIALGALARRGGSVVRFVILRSTDALASFPGWALVLAVMLLDWRTHRSAFWIGTVVILTAALFSPHVVRLVAGSVERSRLFADLLAQAGRDAGQIILFLATVDFFGWGVQPPTPSLGNMLSNMQPNVEMAWWNAILPALCIFAFVFPLQIAVRRLEAGHGRQDQMSGIHPSTSSG